MTSRLALYRLFRLRRLIGVASGVPTLLLLFFALFAGWEALLLLPLTIGLPLAHALRYPNEWVETILLSALLVAGIYLTGVIGVFLGPVGKAVLVLLVVAIAVGLFIWLSERVPDWLDQGVEEPLMVTARARSRRPLAELRDKIVLTPGRRDARVTCHQPDDDGLFKVTYHFETPTVGGFALMTNPVSFKVRQEVDEPECHEVRVVGETGNDVSALRTSFAKTWRGTAITMEEIAEPMTKANAVGFWLMDGLADYLTDELDRAEGRPPRANRFLPRDSLSAEMARWFDARMGRGATPAE
ncbi:MAG: hypothetical protein AAF919_01510 [Pseudomonadota bacterium]